MAMFEDYTLLQTYSAQKFVTIKQFCGGLLQGSINICSPKADRTTEARGASCKNYEKSQ